MVFSECERLRREDPFARVADQWHDSFNPARIASPEVFKLATRRRLFREFELPEFGQLGRGLSSDRLISEDELDELVVAGENHPAPHELTQLHSEDNVEDSSLYPAVQSKLSSKCPSKRKNSRNPARHQVICSLSTKIGSKPTRGPHSG
eukprot:CAMPEP_0168328924 /NCGR_PEP_ID=MMETSP0213-20121227/6798_1 /TAXON_ID=151035 /ORGANISM="Euplotes harpa, Strain FSP1.4" /LENGTH=148 /DNA_ID=CAMNT_0008332143 /DNA_START=276 /DNA_END=723 /DNA_ORIENTATION=+